MKLEEERGLDSRRGRQILRKESSIDSANPLGKQAMTGKTITKSCSSTKITYPNIEVENNYIRSSSPVSRQSRKHKESGNRLY